MKTTIVNSLFRMALVWGFIQFPSLVQATSIDLNSFSASPATAVTIAPSGGAAAFVEDATISPVLLANDPGLGDPNVIIPGHGILLSFDYNFLVASGNKDEFGAFVIDAATGVSAGVAYEFFTQSTGSGTVSFNLSALAGQTLGLQFQLSSLPGDSGLGSTLTVANVRLAESAAPEPGSLWLILAGGLSGWLAQRNRKIVVRMT